MAANLSNADFRSLLDSADGTTLQELTDEQRLREARKLVEEESKKEKRKKRFVQSLKIKKPREGPPNAIEDVAPSSPEKKQPPPSPSAVVGDNQKRNEASTVEKKLPPKDTEEDRSAYVDRAALRRQMKGDYAAVAEEFELTKIRSMEESKYLGGDVEHTHLVKGLDFTLLSKMRAELDQIRQHELSKKKEEPAQKAKRGVHSDVARGVVEALTSSLHPHHCRFKDKLEKVDTTILRGSRFKGNTNNFAEGRVKYQFETSIDVVLSDIPTTSIQSSLGSIAGRRKKEDGSSVSNPMPLHPKIVELVGEIVQWHKMNRKKSREERLTVRPGAHEVSVMFGLVTDHGNAQAARHARASEVQTAKPVTVEDDEDDIFTEAGGYDPKEELKKIPLVPVDMRFMEDAGLEMDDDDD